MRWVELVLRYIEALVWPGVVVFALLKYQRPLKELLGRLRKADALGASFDFESEISEAAAVSSHALQRPSQAPPAIEAPDTDKGGAGSDTDTEAAPDDSGQRQALPDRRPSMTAFNAEELDRLLALAASRRFEAIGQAWDALHRVIEGVDDHIEFTKPNMLGVKERDDLLLLKELERLGVLGPEIIDAVNELRDVYLSAMYSIRSPEQGNVSVAAVITYVTTAYRIANAIAEAGRRAYNKKFPV